MVNKIGKNIIFGALLLVLISSIVYAHATLQDPGVTPDSFIWGLDKALDNIVLLLTFDKGEKARKGLEIAQERLLEVKAMIEENKLEQAEKAQKEHSNVLVKVKKNIKYIEDKNSFKEIEKVIEIEKEVNDHDEEVNQISDSFKIKIKVEGELTQEQKDLINSILDSLKGQTNNIEIEIQDKKNKIKIKIKQETSKSEEEIEIEIEDIEEENGINSQEEALEAIKEAEEEFNETLEESIEKNITISQNLTEQFNSLLGKARSEYEKGNYTEAKKLAKQAEKLLNKDDDEEREDDDD